MHDTPDGLATTTKLKLAALMFMQCRFWPVLCIAIGDGHVGNESALVSIRYNTLLLLFFYSNVIIGFNSHFTSVALEISKLKFHWTDARHLSV